MKMRDLILYLLIPLCMANGFAQSRQRQSNSVPRPKRTITKLPEDLIEQLINDDAEVRSYVNENNDRRKSFEAELIDLNGDGKPESEIDNTDPASPFCFVEGNCTSWLYRKTDNGWELLLTTDVPVLPLKTSTHGYRDIAVHRFVGAVHEYKTIYKFDGRRYQPKECFEWENLKGHKLISRGPCKN